MNFQNVPVTDPGTNSVKLKSYGNLVRQPCTAFKAIRFAVMCTVNYIHAKLIIKNLSNFRITKNKELPVTSLWKIKLYLFTVIHFLFLYMNIGFYVQSVICKKLFKIIFSTYQFLSKTSSQTYNLQNLKFYKLLFQFWLLLLSVSHIFFHITYLYFFYNAVVTCAVFYV